MRDQLERLTVGVGVGGLGIMRRFRLSMEIFVLYNELQRTRQHKDKDLE